LSIRFRAEVDVWIEEDLSLYLEKTGSTSMLNELAKQQIAKDITDALNIYGLNSSVSYVSKSTK
jgi:hypothetical protein